MARNVYFSYKCTDVSRAIIVRDSWITHGSKAAGFIDAADIERIERQGESSVQQWIDQALQGTSVTVVLVGRDTCTSQWVRHEIEKSISAGNALLGVDISNIPDEKGNTSELCGELPAGYPFYDWVRDEGEKHIGEWIERAAKADGR